MKNRHAEQDPRCCETQETYGALIKKLNNDGSRFLRLLCLRPFHGLIPGIECDLLEWRALCESLSIPMLFESMHVASTNHPRLCHIAHTSMH